LWGSSCVVTKRDSIIAIHGGLACSAREPPLQFLTLLHLIAFTVSSNIGPMIVRSGRDLLGPVELWLPLEPAFIKPRTMR
jgi:hypothetical protein